MSLDIQKTTGGKLLISRKETAVGKRRSEIFKQRSDDLANAVKEIQEFLVTEKQFEPKFKIISERRQ